MQNDGYRRRSTNGKTAVIDAKLRLSGNGSVAMQAVAALNAKTAVIDAKLCLFLWLLPGRCNLNVKMTVAFGTTSSSRCVAMQKGCEIGDGKTAVGGR
jgi:hypothetical protein